MAQGRWVLVEDINLAPAEVLAALVPLLERRSLSIAARAESVAAAPGFQLIATVTSAPGQRSSRSVEELQHLSDRQQSLTGIAQVDPHGPIFTC